ncbi:hypothetical protein KCP75_23050 [Salmonella enterica subsp. enterica]|nr:hypothetical protein KCP75_23050 [Salmonella enterica subsp. enterica]
MGLLRSGSGNPDRCDGDWRYHSLSCHDALLIYPIKRGRFPYASHFPTGST